MRHFTIQTGLPQAGKNAAAYPAAEVRRKVNELVRLVSELEAPTTATPAPHGHNPPESNPAVSAERVTAILRARRARARFFDEELFADPAWDILLELYSDHLAGGRMCISSLCVGAAVPATTALRWINTLERKGLILRWPDPLDRRRVFVRLSDSGVTAMGALFAAVPRAESLI